MRTSNWPALLRDFVAENKSRPPVANPCAFFAGDWVKVLTGVDPVETYRDKTAATLTELARTRNFLPLLTSVMQDNKWPEIKVAQARRGDVVLATAARGGGLGVCLGALSVFIAPDGSLSRCETLKCSTAWRID